MASNAFGAGIECERFRPHVMLLDVHISDSDVRSICKVAQGQRRPPGDQGHRDERQAHRRPGRRSSRTRASTARSASRSASARSSTRSRERPPSCTERTKSIRTLRTTRGAGPGGFRALSLARYGGTTQPEDRSSLAGGIDADVAGVSERRRGHDARAAPAHRPGDYSPVPVPPPCPPCLRVERTDEPPAAERPVPASVGFPAAAAAAGDAARARRDGPGSSSRTTRCAAASIGSSTGR